MSKSILFSSQPAPGHPSRKSLPACVHTPLVILAAITALFAIQSVAQASAAQSPSQPLPTPASNPAARAGAHKPVQRRKHPAHAHPLKAQAPVAPAPETPPTPEPPNWPANDKPADASVTWDSLGLLITARNSSLRQILEDVSAATGARVEGLGADQRIFGAYGPGKARDVLSQLLDGTGYNVLMIGDQGDGTPRQIVLTARGAANTQAGANPAQLPVKAAEEEAEPNEELPEDPGARGLDRRGIEPNEPGSTPPR